MRSDKEQLDLILQKKEIAERNRRCNRRIAFSALTLVLCLSVVLSYVVVAGNTRNQKGETAGDRYWAPNEDGVIGGGFKNEDANLEFDREPEHALKDEAVEAPDKDGVGTGDVFEPVPEPTGPQETAGTLTGGEIKDHADYKGWLTTAKAEGWDSLGEKWGLSTANRITVTVKGVRGARVQLLDKGGTALYNAVTDVNGTAYLFVNVQDNIKTVAVTSGEKSATKEYDGTEYSFDMAQSETAKKMDLMFVVDTTGSMGDELEYLKVEIADVIDRISDENIAVRTSVNFYRDEGDDYVVKYFGFNTDANAVQKIVKEQYATGGGDYEEAVHTALNNAVNDHAWEMDSVKVMFLVLDAPPHNDSAVIESLSATVKKAAAMGIRIIPVASSGIDKHTEGLLRSMALVTGGTYTFLTDDSGVGGSHLPPSTESYDVEPLNDMLVRIALEYLGIKVDKTKPNIQTSEDVSYVQ